MDLQIEAHIPYAPELVFTVFRDQLDRVAAHLPNIRSITITSRQDRGNGVVDNSIEWHAGADVPAPLRFVLGESMMSWTDYASWDERTLSCTWRTETHAFVGAVRCGALDRFLEEGPGKTLLSIRGALEVDGGKIRGVPSVLAGSVGRRLETFLVAKIQGELVKTAAALAQYLAERDASPGGLTERARRPAPSAART
jgi:hypothetical protein